jgi:hypothetical protein
MRVSENDAIFIQLLGCGVICIFRVRKLSRCEIVDCDDNVEILLGFWNILIVLWRYDDSRNRTVFGRNLTLGSSVSYSLDVRSTITIPLQDPAAIC